MQKKRTAFVTFFPIFPNSMGSSEVVNSRFLNWPDKKKIFQISHLKNINNKKIETIKINVESPLRKIIKLPLLVFKIKKYLQGAKDKTLIIEGASWIFYSFFVLISLKLIFRDCKIIYISHSIESEIRKKYSNKLIYILTIILENFVLRLANISTSVSLKEKIKLKKLYSINTNFYPNGINLKFKKKIKKINDKYIIFSGSYSYEPNKDAIDLLNEKIMPELIKLYPNLKLVITGGGFDKKFPWVIYKNIVPKNELYNLIYYSECMCVPLKFGSGTRIKIMEALSLGAIVISSKKGIEGLKLLNKNPPFIYKNKDNLIKLLKLVLSYNKEIKKKSNQDKKFYINKFSMKNITSEFIKNYLN